MKYPELALLNGVFGVLKPRGITAAKICNRIRSDLVRGMNTHFVEFTVYYLNNIMISWSSVLIPYSYRSSFTGLHMLCCWLCAVTQSAAEVDMNNLNIKTEKLCQFVINPAQFLYIQTKPVTEFS